VSYKIIPWKLTILFGTMLLFVLGIPSLPPAHRLVYWVLALVVEATLCLTLLWLRPRQ
jgi:hypothetical protein